MMMLLLMKALFFVAELFGKQLNIQKERKLTKHKQAITVFQLKYTFCLKYTYMLKYMIKYTFFVFIASLSVDVDPLQR